MFAYCLESMLQSLYNINKLCSLHTINSKQEVIIIIIIIITNKIMLLKVNRKITTKLWNITTSI